MADALTPKEQSSQLIDWLHLDKTEEATRAIESGMDLNVPDRHGTLPIIAAVQNLHEDICLQMIEHGADIKVLGADGETLLHTAIDKNFTKLFNKLISMGEIDVDAKTHINYTALIYAAFKNREYFTRILLEQGANPNILNNKEDSPLCIAARKGYEPLCRMLLENGAHPKIVDGLQSPLIQSLSGDSSITELLLRFNADPSELLDGAESFKDNMQKLVDDVFPKGYTPAPEKYFTGSKPSDAVLNACALGQFIDRVATPLMNADKKLFKQLIDTLPKCWNHQYRDLKVTAAKSDALRGSIDLGQEGGRHA